MMLDVRDLHVRYGRIEAISGISLHVAEGEIVVVIGPNGAGKSTLLKSIIGLLSPSSGDVLLGGKKVSGKRAYDLMKMGITLVPEGRQVFPDLSVYDNLIMGGYHRLRRGQRKAVQEDIERYFTLFPILKSRKEQLAGTLSGGEQQMLAIARGLMSSPSLMLMDEPSLGLAPKIAKDIFDVLTLLHKEGKTILLVEQLAWLGLEICHRGYLLEKGRIVLEGTKDELLANTRIIETYVGRKAE